MNEKFILDACCGGRHFWFNKKHPNTLYIDIREEDKGFIKERKHWECKPDMIADFRNLEGFRDNSFKLIVWDPPHLIAKRMSGYMTKKYGCLNPETWQGDFSRGFKELWRVLEDHGILVFKFNNFNVPFKEVLKQFPIEPLFGSITVKKTKSETRWFTFMKIPKKLETLKIPKNIKEDRGNSGNLKTMHLQTPKLTK